MKHLSHCTVESDNNSAGERNILFSIVEVNAWTPCKIPHQVSSQDKTQHGSTGPPSAMTHSTRYATVSGMFNFVILFLFVSNKKKLTDFYRQLIYLCTGNWACR